MNPKFWMMICSFWVCLGACAHPMIRASVTPMDPVERQYAADPNRCYYAVRHALAARGYPVAQEDLPGGVITTAWVPTTADSHFLQPFRSRDYGTTGGYHQLEVRVVPSASGRTQVVVTSRCKSVAAFLVSSGVEEGAVLAAIGDYLRSAEVEVTNVGVDE